MTRCRIPDFCERYKIDIGIYDAKSKRILPRNVNQNDICVHIHKNHYCLIWKKNRGESLPNGVEKTDEIYQFVKKKQK